MHSTAAANAQHIIPISLLKNAPVPKTIHMDAPNADAEDTPIVNGLTRGFLVTACIAVPDTARPIPATIAIAILGSLIKTIIL